MISPPTNSAPSLATRKLFFVTLLLAVAYAVTAYLSSYLRIPPSFSACLFPPTGIAVAAFLVYGWRVWPGVVIGALSISPMVSNASFEPQVVMLSLTLAIIPAIQAAVARWLAIKMVGYPTALTDAKDIFRFFLYAGPIATLVSSLLSHGVLLSADLIPATNLAFSIWTWWIGDTLGVLLVTPLILAFIGEPEEAWRARRLSVAVPLIVTLVAVFGLFLRSSHWESTQLRESLEQEAKNVRDALQAKVVQSNEILFALERFYTGSNYVSAAEFSAFVARVPTQHAPVEATFWLAHIDSAEENQAWINLSEREALPAQPNRTSFESDTARLTYWVGTRGPIIGTDIHADPRFTALLQTVTDSDRPVSFLGSLVDPGAASRLVSLLPVFKEFNDSPRKLLGYVGLELSIPTLLNHTLTHVARTHMSLRLNIVGTSSLTAAQYTPRDFQPPAITEMSTNPIQVNLNNVYAQLNYLADASFFDIKRSWHTWILIGGGLLFAVALCYFLLITSGATAQVRNLVRARTSELTMTNKILNTITSAQTDFITEVDTNNLFNRLLERLLDIAASEYGFIGEVQYGANSKPFLRTRAITNIAWDEETRNFYDKNAPKGLEFYNLDTLFGAVLVSRQAVISNDPKNDPRGTGTPPGHPPLDAFLGLPFFKGREMVGMIGLANREGGYDEAVIETIQPVLSTIANIIDAHRTARRRDESDHILRESESRMRAILDSAMDAIITIDVSGKIESINPAAMRLFGYSEREMVGKNVSMIIPGPHRDQHQGYIEKFLETHKRKLVGIPREFNAVRKDGLIFPIEIALSDIRVNNKRLFTAILHDLSERHRADKMKNEFISTVSHELRTPLTSIIGSLGLVLGGAIPGVPEKANEMISIAKKNADRLVRLINDILDIEKIESGKLDVCLKLQPLTPLVDQGIELTQGFAQKFGVTITRTSPLSKIANVNVDGDRLIQVINNLLSNAVKFSPQSSSVDVSVTPSARSVRVSVADHGPGIPEEFQERIFKKFAQADSSDTRKHPGTGLGLNISKALIESMGGRINYETTLGQGTTFYFDLPIEPTTTVTDSKLDEVTTGV